MWLCSVQYHHVWVSNDDVTFSLDSSIFCLDLSTSEKSTHWHVFLFNTNFSRFIIYTITFFSLFQFTIFVFHRSVLTCHIQRTGFEFTQNNVATWEIMVNTWDCFSFFDNYLIQLPTDQSTFSYSLLNTAFCVIS